MSLIRSLRFCFHLICIFWLTGLCDAVVGDIHQSTRVGIRKRAFYAITGVQSGRGGNGAPPPRLEIRKLRQNNAQWNLYLLALNEFYYSQQETAKTSYYQVAGIHGRPFVTWDNVQFGNGLGGGYCPHSSTVFPTWHRPYLALYEQILYDIVQTVAKTFNSAEYTQAAQTFRIPYWDWAADVPAGKHVLPDTISGSPFIQLQVPTGNKVINNPLFRYHFKPLNPNDLPDTPVSTEFQGLVKAGADKRKVQHVALHPKVPRFTREERSESKFLGGQSSRPVPRLLQPTLYDPARGLSSVQELQQQSMDSKFSKYV